MNTLIGWFAGDFVNSMHQICFSTHIGASIAGNDLVGGYQSNIIGLGNRKTQAVYSVGD